MKVLASYSIKGGVGKTTAAVNLAAEAAAQGARVLLWDLDPQGAATWAVRVKPKVKGGAAKMVGRRGQLAKHLRASEAAAVDVLPADFSLRHIDVHLDDVKRPTRRLGELLAPLTDDYDIAILDCPPSISLASESVFGASDVLLVPTIPTPLAARTLEQLVEFLASWPSPPTVLPYISMIDRRKRLQRDVAAQLIERWPQFLTTQIPNTATIERIAGQRTSVRDEAPRSAAAAAFRQLWEEIAAALWA